MMNSKLHNQLEESLSRFYSQETVTSYLYIIERFLTRHPKANRYKLADIEAYVSGLKQEGYSAGYLSVIVAAIKAYYVFCVDTKKISEHPCRSFFIRSKRSKGKHFDALLTLEEMEVLFTLRKERYRHMENRNKAIIGLLIYQGLTSTEMVNLKLDSIDLELGCVTIPTSKKQKGRTIQLKPMQVTHLLRYIETDRPQLQRVKTNKLLLSKRGEPLAVDSIHAFVHSMQGAFDKSLTPRNIRNSVISHWVNERKIPLEDVQVMAGHKYPSSTESFVRVDMDEQREAVNKLHNSIFSM